MDLPYQMSAEGEDNAEIPDDLRCKRSDGKQWRCTAMSMPDKTVCEKHYHQAKKRAASSAMRASNKKAKRGPVGESDIYIESKSDDMELAPSSKFGDRSVSHGKKKEKLSKPRHTYSPEMPSVKRSPARTSARSSDDFGIDGSENEENRSYRTPPLSAVDSSRSRSKKMVDTSPTTETSDESSEASDSIGRQPCHQCRSNDRERVVWCLKCNKRGYCENCISTWYSDIPVEEIQSVCPACRGTCSCRVCMRADNLIKARIREIPAQDKLQYLYCLLSAVLPIVKRIHSEQCSEVELEKKLEGNQIDLARTKLNADEQMCCDFCRVPIIDYHRHCPSCSFDLCLSCCKDMREAPKASVKAGISKHVKLSDVQLNSFKRLADWKPRRDGSIPCPPREYGGCSSSLLTLRRIFKINWVAKVLKNVEELVYGCMVHNSSSREKSGFDLSLCQAAERENDDDNFLYHPSSEDVKNQGVKDFRAHWSKGKPIIVKEVCDTSAVTIWDPMIIWKGIKETTDEKKKGPNRIVKAVDCSNWNQINIELEEFMKGYFDGRINENGQRQMLKLKDWPLPSSSEEFLLYQRPDFLSKLPLLEFIHSKWGLLNVAAKLPHYSLQADVGPKILISYGAREEILQGNSRTNLRLNMRDMVFLLVHTYEVKIRGFKSSKIETEKAMRHSDTKEESAERYVGEAETVNHLENREISDKPEAGALFDVFRHQDTPQLVEYINTHWEELKVQNITNGLVSPHLYDGLVYLNGYHKSKLKEEFGVEPWSFEQDIGEAVFIPAGCPFQIRHLRSTVQLGLDFLSPESLSEAVRLSQEIRGLPNDHDMKLQIMEVGKISLYAASSAIKEVRKLVLDPKIGPELGFEDPNLTSLVSHNLENMVMRRRVPI